MTFKDCRRCEHGFIKCGFCILEQEITHRIMTKVRQYERYVPIRHGRIKQTRVN